MPHYTYILRNITTGRHYIGSTNDIDRRLKEHNRGQTRSTNQNGKWSIIYIEEHSTYAEASAREKVIKSYKGGSAFKQLIAGLVHR